MKNTAVLERLKVVLADSYCLYLKTQNYHWNVTGPNFKELHELFELQYTELAIAIDDIAERIRALGDMAPGSFSIFSKFTTINEAKAYIGPETMITDLIGSHMMILESIRKAIKEAEKIKDEATIGLLTDRLAAHEKSKWMLESSM